MIIAYVPSPTPQTNADRIRSMNDEELADWIAKWCHAAEDCACCPIKNCPHIHCKSWLEWLKQPAEEDAE